MLTSLKKESYFLTWSFEGFSVPIYGDTSLVLLQGQLDSVPVAVKELNPRCPDLDGAGAEIKVNVQVTVEELDREVILQVNDQQITVKSSAVVAPPTRSACEPKRHINYPQICNKYLLVSISIMTVGRNRIVDNDSWLRLKNKKVIGERIGTSLSNLFYPV